MIEAFEALKKQPPDVLVERMTGGSKLTESIYTLFKDIAKAEELYADCIREAVNKARKTESELLRQNKSPDGIMELWQEALRFVGHTASLHEHMSNAMIKKIATPLKDLSEEYNIVHRRIEGKSEIIGTECSEKIKRRAIAKIKIAGDEVSIAEDSRKALIERFGKELKPELLQKADERLKRAIKLQNEAKSDLERLCTVGSNPMEEGEQISLAEKSECGRVLRSVDSIRIGIRLYYTFLDAMRNPILALSRACDAYTPAADLTQWLQTLSEKKSVCLQLEQTIKNGLTPEELDWLGKRSELGEEDVKLASMKNLLAKKDKEISALKEQLTSAQQHFQQGEPQVESGLTDSRDLPAPAGFPDTPKLDASNHISQTAICREQPILTSHEAEFSEQDSNPQHYPEEEPNMFNLDEYIPRLKARLRFDPPPDAMFSDRALEVERRLEEYLWSLRNANVEELTRPDDWANNRYIRGFDVEFAFPAYIHSFPKNTLYTLHCQCTMSHALEWGSTYLNTREWRLFSYETLILAQQITQRILQTRELATLPHRDVATIKPEVLEEQVARTYRMKRLSGITPIDELRGVRAEEALQTQAVYIMLHNMTQVKALLRQWRIRQGISAKENIQLMSLLLPTYGFGECDISHSPMDVRYRLHRLELSWVHAKEIMALHPNPALFNKWVFRNLHFVRISVLFKLQRLGRFLPQLKGTTQWLNTWLISQDWCRYIQSCIPAPTPDDNNFARGNLTKIVNAFKLMCIILADYFNAHYADEWGEDQYVSSPNPVDVVQYSAKAYRFGTSTKEHSDSYSESVVSEEQNYRDGCTAQRSAGYGYRNQEGFLRLGALMSCVALLDRSIRVDIALAEKDLQSSTVSSNEIALSDDNPQIYGGDEPFETSKFDLYKMQSQTMVDTHWQYELPIQHMVLAETAVLASDMKTPTKLSADAVSAIQCTTILSHMMNFGIDPTTHNQGFKQPTVTTTMEAVCIYVLRGMWEAILVSPKCGKADSDFDFDIGGFQDAIIPEITTIPAKLIIAAEPLRNMCNIAKDFVGCLIAKGAHSTIKLDSDENNVSDVVTVRLLNTTAHNLFDCLAKDRCGSRGSAGDGLLACDRHYTDTTDPDFAVLDYGVLDELADNSTFFHQINTIRNEPEGVSVLLPSRIERIIAELCLKRVATLTFRKQLFQTLCDYRQYYDTSSLPLAIELWQTVNDMLFLTPYKAQPQPIDVNQFQAFVELPILLSGPIAVYDMLRHFIYQSVRQIFSRIFVDPLSHITKPPKEHAWFLTRLPEFDEEDENEKLVVEKAWSEVIGRFGTACRKAMDEVRIEVIHYADIWAPLLPGNQHAMIVMFTAEEQFRVCIRKLRSSPYWPLETLPPNCANMISALSQFDKLLRQVRLGTRFESLLADTESVLTSLNVAVASALTKRLRTVEPILLRCIIDDWKPVDPPTTLHSSGAVDFFQFAYHILSAVWEYEISGDWVIPVIVQFLNRVSRQYAEKIKNTVGDSKLYQISKYVDSIIQNLANPLPRVDISLIGQMIGKHKKRGLRDFFGFGGSGTKKKDLMTQLRMQKQMNDVVDNAKLHDGSDVEDLGVASEVDSENGQKKTKWDKHGDQEVFEELKELARRIGPGLALQLYGVATALEGGNPGTNVRNWVTRLHNLVYFHSEISTLAGKILLTAQKQERGDDERQSDVLLTLEKSGGRKVILNADLKNDDSLQKKVQIWQNELNLTVAQSQNIINQKAQEVCQLCAIRIVYFDLSTDLFEEMYFPSIASGHRLCHIINAMDSTVLKFVKASPVIHQETLMHDIAMNLAKAWGTLLTELGYMGHQYTAEELRILRDDLDALKNFIIGHKVRDMTEKGLLHCLSDFLDFLQEQPATLAQLGGNFQAKKSTEDKKSVSPEDNEDDAVADGFAKIGIAQPAFNPEDIVGKKKKKNTVLGGAMKIIKRKR